MGKVTATITGVKLTGVLYLLHSPIMAGYGLFTHFPITVEIAREAVKSTDRVVSAIGSPAVARLASFVLDRPVEARKVRIEMQPGDVALVIKAMVKLPEERVLSKEEMLGVPYRLSMIVMEGRKVS